MSTRNLDDFSREVAEVMRPHFDVYQAGMCARIALLPMQPSPDATDVYAERFHRLERIACPERFADATGWP